MFDLTGRVALVTGAGRGVGAGIAGALRQCGADVAVNDLVAERAADIADSLGGVAAPADVTDDEAVANMVEEVEARLGRIDILVNNAGVPSEGAP
jgi:meso-butanediol dehydrogenase / (S,S)-butanediol dehydrogenase / diacetyl reductase